MPLFDDAGSPYGFSATRIEDLGASEYTLVSLVADASPSVTAFKQEIEACVQEIVRACRRSPRADNLMLRYTTFSADVREVHGFRQLVDCAPQGYADSPTIGSSTALYDAAHNGVEAVALVEDGLEAFRAQPGKDDVRHVRAVGIDRGSLWNHESQVVLSRDERLYALSLSP